MELIKLSIDLGVKVLDILKTKGYQPRTNSNGIYSLEFSQQELSEITTLELFNIKPNSLEGIDNFHNLQSLKIDSDYSAYDNANTGISDKDIKYVANVTSLKSLTIKNQAAITWVYLDKLTNLEEIHIERNNRLDTISGLDKLYHVRELSIYGNKELYMIDHIKELILNNELNSLELDLLNFPEVSDQALRGKLFNIINCRFSETLSHKGTVSYNYGTASIFHQRCLEICDAIIGKVKSPMEAIILIERYLAQNINYDYKALDREDRFHTEAGNKIGFNNGTQSAYNGIMYGSCVCEGYTRAMQYLLKIIGLPSKNVYCIGGKDKISIKTDYHNQVVLPDDGYHSIIRVDCNDGIYYCDPCWDSCRWHRGNETLPYCLKNKGEITTDHTLSFEEDNIVDNPVFHIPRAVIQEVLLKYNSSPEKADNGFHK